MTNQDEPDQLKTPTSLGGNRTNPKFRSSSERRIVESIDSAKERGGGDNSLPDSFQGERLSVGREKNTPRSASTNASIAISQEEGKSNSGKRKRGGGFSPRFSNWLSQVLGGVSRQKQLNSTAKNVQASRNPVAPEADVESTPKAPPARGRRSSLYSSPNSPNNSAAPRSFPVSRKSSLSNPSINSSNSSNSSPNSLNTPLPRRQKPAAPLSGAIKPNAVDKTPKRPSSRKKGRGSPVIYGLRLLILGVGLGAIAGTVLYISDPAARPISKTANLATMEANPKAPSPSSPVASPMTAMKLQQGIPALQEQLDALIKARPNFQVGVFLQDLDGESAVNILGDNPLAAASTIKLPILIAFFQDVDAKKISLGEMLTLEKRFVATGSGELQDQPLGTKYTILDVATRMMAGSDNTATNMIIDRLGGLEVLNQRFQSWGLKNTSLQAVLPDLEGANLTTPKELAMVMGAVEQGELVSRRSRDLVFSIMQRTENDTLLPKGLEKNATIAHKTGNLGTLVADAGLIDMPNGKRYILVVMVKRPRNDQGAAELIRQISRTTYNYFKQVPPSTKP